METTVRQFLLAILILISSSTNALTVEDEIYALQVAREYQIDLMTVTGVNAKEISTLERISHNLYQRIDFLKARVEAGETRYLLVNKSEFYMEVIDNGQIVVREKVIIGEPGRATPEFSDIIKYIVINPYWNVPYNLARKDVIPKINRIRNKFGIDQMYTSIDEGGYRFFNSDMEINPHDIDFSQYTLRSKLPFKVRQDPGSHNSLGLIKFVFPNKYNVYIHDTPRKGLFDRDERRFSSGCVRLQNPINLAAYLLNSGTSDILDMINNPDNSAKWIKIPEPLPIHIVDWTITVTDHGVILD